MTSHNKPERIEMLGLDGQPTGSLPAVGTQSAPCEQGTPDGERHHSDEHLSADLKQAWHINRLSRPNPANQQGEGPKSPDRPKSYPRSIGPYRIREVLGEGGMGVVYLADQSQPVRRRVALKVIKRGLDSGQVIARFEAERQALAMMNHPNIAKVFDAGMTEDGRPYFVMEHVAGVSMTEHCDRHELKVEKRLSLFVQVCQALHHAHENGLVHRDLKPGNILVSIQEGKAVVKVIDFGVAKALHQNLTEKTVFTEQGQLIGTPEYMSPEQAEMTAQDIDTRSDIYSLGVLLYELLTGTLPFEGATLRRAGLAEIVRIIREEDPPKPSTRLSSLQTQPRVPENGASETKPPVNGQLQLRTPGSGHAPHSPCPHGCSPDDRSASDSFAAVIARRRDTDPRTLTRTLRGDLDCIVMKCLEKDRTRRYATAKGLEADIRHYLSHEPIVAGPPGTIHRLRKLIGRNKPLVTSSVASVVVFLATAGLVLSGGTHSVHEKLAPVKAAPAYDAGASAILPYRLEHHEVEGNGRAAIELDRPEATDDATSLPRESTSVRIEETLTSAERPEKAAPSVVLVVREDLNICDDLTPTSYGGISQQEYRQIFEESGIEIKWLSTSQVLDTAELCREAGGLGADWVVLGGTWAERMEPIRTDAVSGYRWRLTMSVEVYRAGEKPETIFRDESDPAPVALMAETSFSRDEVGKQSIRFGKRIRERLLKLWKKEHH